MHLYVATDDDSIDTSTIEKFLLVQDGIVNAVVWLKNHSILARVTVTEHSGFDETDIRGMCERKLGKALTPHMVMLERALRPAA